MEGQTKHANRLRQYRRESGMFQKEVSYLLGQKSTAHLSHYERGNKHPCLRTALKLEIIYQTPIAFLFPDLYQELRDNIYQKEEELYCNSKAS